LKSIDVKAIFAEAKIMDATSTRLEHRYASMTTNQLMHTASRELTDAAEEALHEELERRQFTAVDVE
jgi:hypothetical protein